MSNLKLKNAEWKFCTLAMAKELGVNMLGGKCPKITELSNEPFKIEIERVYGEQHLPLLTDDNNIPQHVDFWGAPFNLTYDLGKSEEIDTICISGYSLSIGNYALNDFEIYASSNEAELYSSENLLAKYYRSPEEEKAVELTLPRDNIFKVEGEARFIGIKILSACPSDEITRISRIGVFSDFNSAKYILKNRLAATDCLADFKIEISGEYEGCPRHLNDGRAFFDDEVVKAVGDIKVDFCGEKTLYSSKLYVVGTNVNIGALVADGKNIEFELKTEESFAARALTVLSFPEISADKLSLEIKSGAVLDTVFSDTAVRKATVNENDIIDADYIGAGCDVFPTALSGYGRREGYNEVYWELEKHHMSKSRPHCVRMWFQIDWVVDTLEQYVNGDWQFDNLEMQSAVEYCKAFRDEGIEVELDFGWKVGNKVTDWFSLPELDEKYKTTSAPKDIYNYAKAAVATLEYLILEHGCDNVKYLTFYNEISYNAPEKHYDFTFHGDAVAYFAAMTKYTKYFLDHSKIAGMVEIWGAEQCSKYEEIMDRMNILAPEAFDRHTVHKYSLSYDEICNWCDEELVPHSDGKPILLTEFGNSYRTTVNWEKNTVNNVLGAANHGVSGAFIWVMAGAPLVDPLNWMHAGRDSVNSYQHWNFFPNNTTLDDVGESFYELCLLNHYIPKHARSVRSYHAYKYEDVRFNAFCKDGEYTLFVESKGDRETRISIDIGKAINRTFYRHTYVHHTEGEGNLVVPPTDKLLDITDKIEDSLGEGYSLVVYTTVKPIRQVLMDNVDIRASAGDTVKVGATVIDDDCAQAPSFEISKSIIAGASLENGEVKIPETAKSGDMLSVKAQLATGEYGISIIRVE